jgi:hypothetical protein
MKTTGIISIAGLSLLLGTAALAYAQQDHAIASRCSGTPMQPRKRLHSDVNITV